MVDYQAKRIPIFPDINDVPIAPTETSGGNISHFYDLYNQLVDDLEEHITELEGIAGDGFNIAQNLDARVYDYYYYHITPNKDYIIFQNNNTNFDLGTHNLVSGTNSIGNIPANGELFRIVANGSINNFADIQWEIGGNTLNVPKVAHYPTGAIWWVYDISQLYRDPYGYTPPEVTENDAINLITTSTETAISFRLEMTVYSVPPSSITPPVIEEFVFSNVTTSEVGGNQRATLGTIPKTGKITTITIDDINDGYGTSFIIDETYLTYSDFQIVTDGYEWTYPEDELPEVTQGQEIVMETTAVETNRTVKIYIQSQISSPEPTLEVFEFSGINATEVDGEFSGTVGTIPQTGKLQKIAIDNVNDGYGTFFDVEGNVKSFDAFETATEGYQWVITDDGSQDVSQGEILTWLTSNEETDRTVYLYIYG